LRIQVDHLHLDNSQTFCDTISSIRVFDHALIVTLLAPFSYFYVDLETSRDLKPCAPKSTECTGAAQAGTLGRMRAFVWAADESTSSPHIAYVNPGLSNITTLEFSQGGVTPSTNIPMFRPVLGLIVLSARALHMFSSGTSPLRQTGEVCVPF
jgi:hypothetical protein